MEIYWKTAAGIMLSAILGITVSQKEKDLGMILQMTACCMATVVSLHYISPVIEMIQTLEKTCALHENAVGILMKALGIGWISQIAGTLCADSGSNGLGKILQILSSAAILYLSVPLFSALLEIIQDILGAI